MTSPDVVSALVQARNFYRQQNPRSEALHTKALRSLPGGNTRSVLHADPFPLYIKSGRGYQVVSEDDVTYTDLTGEFSAGLYGHSNQTIFTTIQHVLSNIGLNLSGTISKEQELAALLCRRFSIDQIRFTNSGTEANLQALAAARHFTQKCKIVVFGGGYHGGVLGFAGGKPGANNVDMDDWIVVKYNDVDAAVRAIEGEGVAAVLVEGMQGAGGCIVGTGEFLRSIQDAAKKAGVLFIMDEVMTSRLSGAGFSSLHSLEPDLKTFGKWIGGGITFGAFGGRSEIMAAYDPRKADSLSHSGTFNNNTLAMHAGYVGLTETYTPIAADNFTDTGNTFMERLNDVTRDTILVFTGHGTVMTAHFAVRGERQVRNAGDLVEDQALKELFWLEMLGRGFWIARRGFIALILETPKEELDRFVDAVSLFVDQYSPLLKPRRE